MKRTLSTLVFFILLVLTVTALVSIGTPARSSSALTIDTSTAVVHHETK